MHPHRREKWNELAKVVNGEAQPNSIIKRQMSRNTYEYEIPKETRSD